MKRLPVVIIILLLSISIAWGQSASDWFALGKKADERKDYNTAIDYFAKAINAGPIDTVQEAAIRCSMGFSYEELGKTDKAYKEYKKALLLNPSYVIYVMNLLMFMNKLEGKDIYEGVPEALKKAQKLSNPESFLNEMDRRYNAIRQK